MQHLYIFDIEMTIYKQFGFQESDKISGKDGIEFQPMEYKSANKTEYPISYLAAIYWLSSTVIS